MHIIFCVYIPIHHKIPKGLPYTDLSQPRDVCFYHRLEAYMFALQGNGFYFKCSHKFSSVSCDGRYGICGPITPRYSLNAARMAVRSSHKNSPAPKHMDCSCPLPQDKTMSPGCASFKAKRIAAPRSGT